MFNAETLCLADLFRAQDAVAESLSKASGDIQFWAAGSESLDELMRVASCERYMSLVRAFGLQ